MAEKNEVRVLFLCTGNSARSQMAAGLVNHYLGEHFFAQSAGTAPAAAVHPEAVAAMREVGIDISGQKPKHVAALVGQAFDLVITLCDSAAQTCPVWVGQGKRIHMGFTDPSAAPPEEAAASFRTVRDELTVRLIDYLRSWQLTERR